jgi:hypothetical protein
MPVRAWSLPAKKMLLLEEWRMMWKGRPLEAPPDTFETEAQFKEGTEEYWNAVQQPLLDNNPSELRKGEVMNGYVVVIGAFRVGRRWEWLVSATSSFVYCNTQGTRGHP